MDSSKESKFEKDMLGPIDEDPMRNSFTTATSILALRTAVFDAE